MRRARLLVAALGATTLAIGACSAILDIDPDAFVTANVDASRTVDASNDASVDASSDASGDDAADAPSQRSSPCPGRPRATLCDDFDTDRDAGWSTRALANGSLAVSDAAFSSTPRSLLAETAPDGGDAMAVLVKEIGSATNVTVDFDVRPCDVTAAGFVVINDRQLGDQLSIGFGRDGNGAKAAIVRVALGGAATSPELMPFDFHTKEFVHVRWTTVFAEGNGGSTTLEVGGTILHTKTGIATTSPNVTGRLIQVGVLTSGAACSAYIDNVVIDAR